MSAAKMVADSTQAEPADGNDGKKRKRKVKKTGKKVSLPEDEDSDLDLKKELHPIGNYIMDRSKMVEEMFRAVRGASLQRALPDLLKSIPLEELRQLCMEQLEVMSKKRIRRILAGEESANISSSGTEDDTTDEEMEAAFVDGDKEKEDATPAPPVIEAQPADSTSVHQEVPSKPEEPQPQSIRKPDEPPATGFVSTFQQVEVKQEPPDSGGEEDMEQGGQDDRDSRDDYPPDDEYDDEEDEDEEEEESEEDIEANYTSGSEDGELVRREDQVKVNEETSSEQPVQIKQEPVSDSEGAAAEAGRAPGRSSQTQEKDNEDPDNKGDDEDEEEDDDDDDEEDEEEDEEGANSSLMRLGEDTGGDMVLPSIMMDQMELLELEMRARAIKAMLSTQDGEEG